MADDCTESDLVTLEQVREASKRIEGLAVRTELLPSDPFAADCGASAVLLKLECTQPTGSFKVRGASNAVRCAPAGTKFVASSAGNHGLGVAFAAKSRGAEATIVVPESAAAVKIAGIRALGAKVVTAKGCYDDAERMARQMAADTGAGSAQFLSPYNDRAVIAGQGTVALEMLTSDTGGSAIDTLVVPAGGCGLLSGCCVVARSIGVSVGRKITVYGVQSDACALMRDSLEAGHVVQMTAEMEAAGSTTLAEGLHGGLEEPSVTFQHVRALCNGGVLVVSERDIAEAMRDAKLRHGLVLEGSAAVGLAALRAHRELFRGKTVGVVLTGSNIDPETTERANGMLQK